MKRRVVVTGMGGLSPIGNTVDEMWANAKNGFCGIEDPHSGLTVSPRCLRRSRPTLTARTWW